MCILPLGALSLQREWFNTFLIIFTGSSVLDLISMFGICKADVHKSVEYIMSCKEMEIKFPSNYPQQLQIAQGFQSISRVGFTNCTGTILFDF